MTALPFIEQLKVLNVQTGTYQMPFYRPPVEGLSLSVKRSGNVRIFSRNRRFWNRNKKYINTFHLKYRLKNTDKVSVSIPKYNYVYLNCL